MTYTPLPESLRDPKPATDHTAAKNTAVAQSLPFTDRRSFTNAGRGFIATIEPLTITRPNGQVTYDLSQFEFLQGDAPDTVNPSLWRQAQLNAQHHGLYEITDGLYQVRSFDIANMTLIAGIPDGSSSTHSPPPNPLPPHFAWPMSNLASVRLSPSYTPIVMPIILPASWA